MGKDLSIIRNNFDSAVLSRGYLEAIGIQYSTEGGERYF